MQVEPTMTKPNIFEYDNYRSFLRDSYLFSKAKMKHFSFRYFSRKAGFASPNFLKLVIEGKRNLSVDSVDRFVLALKLSKTESEFFASLVKFNQARNGIERAESARQVICSKGFQRVYPLQQAEFSYYASWFYIPVRELVALKDFDENPEWIARRLIPPITPDEASVALRDLVALGLLRRSETGRLEQVQKTVVTENEVLSASVASYHREMLRHAANSIEIVPRQHREVSAACVPISAKTAAKVKSMIQEFRQEILAIASQDDSPESVYQLNFQLFPLSQWKNEESFD